jgi:glycosyltransferase involved in cell wall biosynthesis
MKILMVDKYYFVKGGVERYIFELKKVLESHGHDVIPFSMKSNLNEDSPYSKYFVENIDFNIESKVEKFLQSFRITGRVIYSFHAKKKLKQLIQKTRPDIAHLHMIDHQISPSILHVLKRYKIPALQTVHQYKFVCPNARMYIDHKNEICERCLGGKFYHSLLQRCHKHSLLASALVTIESYFHHLIKIYDTIKLFHVPSQFIGKKLEEGGIPVSKIHYQLLTIDLDNYACNTKSSDYIVYYGRLSPEKGVLTLLKAFQKLRTNVPLKIIGEGPERSVLETYKNQNCMKNVTFLGYQSGKQLIESLANSMFVVVPSEWYENSPLTIYESFALGKPVIGARIGGIPEFIQDGVNGYLFQSGNVNELASKMETLLEDTKKVFELGKNAREFAENHFAPEIHYKRLLSVYHTLLNRERKK